MFVPVLNAYFRLIQFDLYLGRGNFAALRSKVRHFPIANVFPSVGTPVDICSAVDMACIWYWKEVKCLQRSAVTACLLRSRGVPAHLVIGAQRLPFRAHAWVEVDGEVVNERPNTPAIYATLDRC
jgi:hypothetical protein